MKVETRKIRIDDSSDILNRDSEDFQKILLIIVIGAFFVVITGIAFFSQIILDLTGWRDPPNLSTLIIEIGVGIIIAYIVFSFSKKSEKQNRETLEKIEKMISEEHESSNSKKRSIQGRLLNVFQNILSNSHTIISLSKEWERESGSHKEDMKNEIDKLQDHNALLAEKNIDKMESILYNYFTDSEVRTFKTFSGMCNTKPRFDLESNTCNVSFSHNLVSSLPRYIEYFENELGY